MPRINLVLVAEPAFARALRAGRHGDAHGDSVGATAAPQQDLRGADARAVGSGATRALASEPILAPPRRPLGR
jgi:hypothetical protein